MTKEPVSKSNLSDLKEKWEGWRTFTRSDFRTELEIDNDSLPLKGRFTFHGVQRRGKMSGTNTMEFEHGKIKDNNFCIKRGENEFKLSLHKGDGKMKLEEDFYFMGHRGKMTLNKK